MLVFAGPSPRPVVPVRVQRYKNSGRPLARSETTKQSLCLSYGDCFCERSVAIRSQGASPNPSIKNFLNMSVSDAELLRSKQLTNILKVLWDGGPGEGAFFKTPLPREILYA